jgi:hypothetical protein
LALHQLAPPEAVEAWIAVRPRGLVAGLRRWPGGRPARDPAVPPLEGLSAARANRLAAAAGLAPERRGPACDLLLELWERVVADDLAEVRVSPAAAAVTLDDAARFRHPEWSRFGMATDPAGGPYLARTDLIAAADRGEPVAEAELAALPALDALVVRAYAESLGVLVDRG